MQKFIFDRKIFNSIGHSQAKKSYKLVLYDIINFHSRNLVFVICSLNSHNFLACPSLQAYGLADTTPQLRK